MISEGWVPDLGRAEGLPSGFVDTWNPFGAVLPRAFMNGNWYPILPLFVRRLRYIYTPRGRGVIPSFRFYLAHWKKRENKNNGKKGIGWASRKLMKGRGSSEDPDEIMIMKTMETSTGNSGNNRSDQEHIVPAGNRAKTDTILHVWHIENNRFVLW